MNQWRGNESVLQRAFVKVWDLLILNLCFLACCVPVITAGAGLTALFSVNLKAVRREEGGIFTEYWKAFRSNFRQATALWLILLLLGGILLADFLALRLVTGPVRFVLKVMLGMGLAVYLAVFPWIFGYTARFVDRTGTVLKNALLLSIAELPLSGAMLAMAVVPVVLSFYSVEMFLRILFVWVVLGFALINYCQCILLRRAFDKL